VALVFPVVMLMQMMSAGAMGGGISSSIARAWVAAPRGRRRARGARLVIALVRRRIHDRGTRRRTLALPGDGGSGASLDAALIYSNWVFAARCRLAVQLARVGDPRTGNMRCPRRDLRGRGDLVPLSPALNFGWGPFRRSASRAARCARFLLRARLPRARRLSVVRAQRRAPIASHRALPLAALRDVLRSARVAALVTVATISRS